MEKKDLNKLKALVKKIRKMEKNDDKFVDKYWDESASNDELHHKCFRKMGSAYGLGVAASYLENLINKYEE